MSHHYIANKEYQKPSVERVIRFCLRALGVSALATCVIFWLTLLQQ